MACLSNTSFSICVNGEVHGYFKGHGGLRQGDLMSPYSFTLIMEILTLILRRRVRNEQGFQYHNCHKLLIMPKQEGGLGNRYACQTVTSIVGRLVLVVPPILFGKSVIIIFLLKGKDVRTNFVIQLLKLFV